MDADLGGDPLVVGGVVIGQDHRQVPPGEIRVLRYDLDDGTGRYLLLENRSDQGSDRHLPGHGLLVWSVDPERAELGAWNGDERRPAGAGSSCPTPGREDTR